MTLIKSFATNKLSHKRNTEELDMQLKSKNTASWLYLLIGLLGLSQVVWLNFVLDLPLFMYFIGLPLLVLPSITMIVLGLERSTQSQTR